MRTTYGIWIPVILGILVFVSCEPLEKVSNVPEIHFKTLEGPFIVDTGVVIFHAAYLTFSFKDGDSDIGVPIDPNSDNNLILIPYQKQDGEYDSADAEIYGRQWQIGENEKLNTGSTVRGEIKVQIEYFVFPPPFDTMRYEFYLIDRAGHKSNVEVTSDIGFAN